MSGWSIAWLVWLLAFAVIEGLAIRNDAKGDTLSEHLRRWFRTDTHLGRTSWVLLSSVFLVLFVVHIATSGWLL